MKLQHVGSLVAVYQGPLHRELGILATGPAGQSHSFLFKPRILAIPSAAQWTDVYALFLPIYQLKFTPLVDGAGRRGL